MDGLNTFLISAAAANAGMKVMLSGLGGDELFAGYPGFRYAKKLQEYKFLFDHSKLLRKTVASGISGLNFFGSFPVFKLLTAKSHKIADCYPAFRQIMDIREVGKFVSADDNPANDIRQKIIGFEQSGEAFHLANYSMAEYAHYALNTLLRDNDQAGMAHSIEIREPFFDYRLIEFVSGLPDTVKLSHYPKQLLVDALYPFLPGDINMRKKKGFVLPMEKWMRNELYDLCRNSIHSLGERECMHKPHLMEAWKRFSKGHSAERWTTIWMLVVLGAWMDKNNIS
jgi:asparagine synthase (glutamine-hydrolysing)